MVTVDRCGGVGASFIITFTFVLGAVAVAASMTMSFVFFRGGRWSCVCVRLLVACYFSFRDGGAA